MHTLVEYASDYSAGLTGEGDLLLCAQVSNHQKRILRFLYRKGDKAKLKYKPIYLLNLSSETLTRAGFWLTFSD